MSVDELLNNIIYSNSNLHQIVVDIGVDKYRLKRGEQISKNIDIKTLQYYEDRFSKMSQKFMTFRQDIENQKIEFDRQNQNYVVTRLFYDNLFSARTCRDERLLDNIYREKVKYRDNVRKNADNIQKLISNNLEIVFQVEEKERGFREIKLAQFLEQAGYRRGENISSELQMQAEKDLKVDLDSLGINVEQLQEVDNIRKVILSNNSKKQEHNLSSIEKIYPLEVGNENSEQIFSDIYHKKEELEQFYQENRLLITEEQYNTIVAYYFKIIELYQDVQLMIATKETFKNTQMTKYYDSLDKIIENAHKEIESTANKLNKYISKISKDSNLQQIVDKIVVKMDDVSKNLKDNKESKDNKINKEEKQKQVISESKLNKENDEIIILDSFRQQIFQIEQNKELMQRKTELQIEYNKFRDLKFGQANIPFVKFLEIYYPNEIELIKAEEVREQQIQYVYELWQKSGRHMEFGKYAEHVQGVKIANPHDYTKEEDIINYESYEQSKVKSYVDTKNKSIEEARERYAKKSALWKVFHKKMNPANFDFDRMTNEQVEELYAGKRR